jgi:hypothetical protein
VQNAAACRGGESTTHSAAARWLLRGGNHTDHILDNESDGDGVLAAPERSIDRGAADSEQIGELGGAVLCSPAAIS